ncbi:MAG TPA: hypothetical protein VI318_05900 [Baekduia sp.]
MSSASHPGGTTPLTANVSAAEREQSRTRQSDFPSGWIIFAAVALVMSGGLTALFGLTAVLNDKVVTVGGTGGPAIWDLTGWGWVGIISGLVMIVTGIGLALQVGIARWTAVVLVTIHALLMFPIISAFPILAIIVIALDVVILYELTVAWSRS